MFLAGSKAHHIAGLNLLYWATLALSPPTAVSDNQGLAERMSMPVGSGARLESNTG